MRLHRAPFIAALSLAAVASTDGLQRVVPDGNGGQTPASISVRDGRLTAAFDNVPLAEALAELGARTHLAIVAARGLEDRVLSARANNLPVDEGIRQILRDYDTFFHYGAGAVLRTVWVYRPGDGAAIQPVPAALWSSTRDLEAALDDTDPAIRERAYEALMARPDRAARNRVELAIRGATEADPELRERLLSMALTNGFELTRDVLADLVRADGSETIRLMALDAQSGDPAAREIAVAALNDANEAVRERARDLLVELDSLARRRDR